MVTTSSETGIRSPCIVSNTTGSNTATSNNVCCSVITLEYPVILDMESDMEVAIPVIALNELSVLDTASLIDTDSLIDLNAPNALPIESDIETESLIVLDASNNVVGIPTATVVESDMDLKAPNNLDTLSLIVNVIPSVSNIALSNTASSNTCSGSLIFLLGTLCLAIESDIVIVSLRSDSNLPNVSKTTLSNTALSNSVVSGTD